MSALDEFEEDLIMGTDMIENSTPSPTKEKDGYYKLASGAECIDLVDDIADRENLPGRVRMYAGNAVEYLWRCGKKPGVDWREDLFKAANELCRAVTGSFMDSKVKEAFMARFPRDIDRDTEVRR